MIIIFDITLTDEDLGFELISTKQKKLQVRMAARGIILNDNKIAIFCKKAKNEFKLPGGGIENTESVEEAFKREVFEETGCEVNILKKIGIINEYRSHDNFFQISHVFLGNVIKDTKRLYLTKKEKAEGGELMWCSPIAGLNLMNNAYSQLKASHYESLYHTQFISKRDQLILKYFIEEAMKKLF